MTTTAKHRAFQLDSDDPLYRYRERFYIPRTDEGTEVIYLCGNSLGLQPKSARAFVEQELSDWEKLGVEGHFNAKNPWLPYHELLTGQTARLVGAKPTEVVVMNSLTVNLHLMMVSFYRPKESRYKILIEAGAFPSDQYAVKSHLKFRGYDPVDALIEIHPREGESIIRMEDIDHLLRREGSSIALLMFGGVNYYSGQAFDMKRIAEIAHDRGCLVGFDLAHAAGNLVLRLHDWNVDFAVWCSYKYLNAGPGAVAGCFVHERHASDPAIQRFAGWWGTNKSTRFLMGSEFEPILGAEGWQLSNPPILQMAALRASMEIFDEVGMEKLRAKSELLTGFLEGLLAPHLGEALSIITPGEKSERGAQLSLRVSRNGKSLYEKLTARHVICDWREPDVIRVAPVPLYNSFMDVFRFVEIFSASI